MGKRKTLNLTIEIPMHLNLADQKEIDEYKALVVEDLAVKIIEQVASLQIAEDIAYWENKIAQWKIEDKISELKTNEKKRLYKEGLNGHKHNHHIH